MFQWNGHEVDGYKLVIEKEQYGEYVSDVYYLETILPTPLKRYRIGDWVPDAPNTLTIADLTCNDCGIVSVYLPKSQRIKCNCVGSPFPAPKKVVEFYN